MEQFVYLALDVPLFRGERGVLVISDIRVTICDISSVQDSALSVQVVLIK